MHVHDNDVVACDQIDQVHRMVVADDVVVRREVSKHCSDRMEREAVNKNA